MKQRVTTYAAYDNEGMLIAWEGYEYDGPWEQAKGGASKAEQAKADALTSQEQANQANQLMLQKLYLGAGMNLLGMPNIGQGGTGAPGTTTDQGGAAGGGVLGYLNNMLQSGGATPATQALQAGAINTAGNTYRNALGQFNQLNARYGLTGGDNAGGGGIGQNFGALQAALGGQLQDVNTQMAGMKNQNYLGALSGLTGITGNLLGMGQGFGNTAVGFGNTAVGSLGQGVQAAHNVDQAQTSWMGPVFGALGSLGGGFLGGVGKGMFGGSKTT